MWSKRQILNNCKRSALGVGIPKHSRIPVVPVQLPAESLGVMFFSFARLSTSLVNVLIEGSFCDRGDIVSQGRCAGEAAMIVVGLFDNVNIMSSQRMLTIVPYMRVSIYLLWRRLNFK